MRVLTSDSVGLWIHGAALVALAALAWAIFVPGGVFWTAILAAALIGSVVATVTLVRSRSIPSLADVVASAGGGSVNVRARSGSGSGLRPRGARKP